MNIASWSDTRGASLDGYILSRGWDDGDERQDGGNTQSWSDGNSASVLVTASSINWKNHRSTSWTNVASAAWNNDTNTTSSGSSGVSGTNAADTVSDRGVPVLGDVLGGQGTWCDGWVSNIQGVGRGGGCECSGDEAGELHH